MIEQEKYPTHIYKPNRLICTELINKKPCTIQWKGGSFMIQPRRLLSITSAELHPTLLAEAVISPPRSKERGPESHL